MVRRRYNPGEPLSPELLRQLGEVSKRSDEEISFADIPRLSDEQLAEFVRGPWPQLEKRTVTLSLDPEVAEWIEHADEQEAGMINHLLKQLAQKRKRAQAHPPADSQLSKAS